MRFFTASSPPHTNDDPVALHRASPTGHGCAGVPAAVWEANAIGLLEMVSRGQRFEGYLSAVLRSRREARPSVTGLGHRPANLEILTALRRVQGLPDPLCITVSKPPLEASFPRLPVYLVRIENVDVEGESVWFTDGGNHHGGRRARWRMDVTDSNGKSIGIRESWPSGGGGTSLSRALEKGECWGRRHPDAEPDDVPDPVPLPAEHYVELFEPGEYTVRIQYHNEKPIAAELDVSELVLTTSAPLRFQYRPLSVELGPSTRQRIKEMVDQVLREPLILLFDRPYDPTMKFFGEPSSGCEALFRCGWQALPVLVETLDAAGCTAHQRAWMLAMLYNITGLLDPRGYDAALGAWQASKLRAKTGGFVVRLGAGGDGGGPVRESQEALIKKWRQLARMIRVVEPRR